MSNRNRKIAVIDGDGVLFDFDKGYVDNWEKVFGYRPTLTNPHAYWIADRWGIPTLEGDDLLKFQKTFDHEFWANLEMISGAAEACRKLKEAGYELICGTALQPQFQKAREENLVLHNIPIPKVVVTPSPEGYNRWVDISPKAELVHSLNAEIFVDDYLPYHRGLPGSTWKCLIAWADMVENNSSERDMLINVSAPSLIDFTNNFLGE